jgi:hypothetical protein
MSPDVNDEMSMNVVRWRAHRSRLPGLAINRRDHRDWLPTVRAWQSRFTGDLAKIPDRLRGSVAR